MSNKHEEEDPFSVQGLEEQARLEVAKERERERQRGKYRDHLEKQGEKGKPRRERDLKWLEEQKAKEAPPTIGDIWDKFVSLTATVIDYNANRPRGTTPQLKMLRTGEFVAVCDICRKTSEPFKEATEAVQIWGRHHRQRCGGG